jgi:hypothetical protein
MLGAEILSGFINPNLSNEIDISKLNDGIYIINIIIDDKIYQNKFIKM